MTFIEDANGIWRSNLVETGDAAIPIDANWATISTYIGAHTIGEEVQAYSANLDAWAGMSPSAVAITGGTMNGAVIGGVTPAAITGTVITAYADQAIDSTDPSIIIRRTISTGSGNAHGFADNSDVSRAGTIGYAANDVRTSYSGANDFDHHASYQSSPTYSGSGTINDIYGTYLTGLITAGTVLDWFGERIEPPTISGGSLTNFYGVFIDNADGVASNEWGIYTGAIISRFGGDVYVANPSGSVGTGADMYWTSGSSHLTMARAHHTITSTSQGNLFLGVRTSTASGDAGITDLITLTGGASANIAIAAPLNASGYPIHFGTSASNVHTPAGASPSLTINLANAAGSGDGSGNHHKLNLTGCSGTLSLTLDAPAGITGGMLFIKQHAATQVDITIAADSPHTLVWHGPEPDWGASAVGARWVVSWGYDPDDDEIHLVASEAA